MEGSVPESSIVELTAVIARALVDLSEDVSVKATSNEFGTMMRLRVDPTDVSKVIGKQGKMARSIRTLLVAISAKFKLRYSREIVEESYPHPQGQE